MSLSLSPPASSTKSGREVLYRHSGQEEHSNPCVAAPALGSQLSHSLLKLQELSTPFLCPNVIQGPSPPKRLLHEALNSWTLSYPRSATLWISGSSDDPRQQLPLSWDGVNASPIHPHLHSAFTSLRALPSPASLCSRPPCIITALGVRALSSPLA